MIKKEVDVELSFEKPLPRKQEKGRGSSRSNNRRRRSDNRDRNLKMKDVVLIKNSSTKKEEECKINKIQILNLKDKGHQV